MKVLVICGSPKGGNSITLHTCLYLEKQFPALQFEYIQTGTRIKALEKDFTPALEAVRAADLLLFCYPVYTFLVPYQLHRFIELMKASGPDFSGKAATQVSTSKHFYDVTAHRFIEDNCADLSLPFLDGLSADMDDILSEKGRKQAVDWLAFTLWKLDRGDFKRPLVAPAPPRPDRVATVPAPVPHSAAKKAVIVTDLLPDDTALKAMIARFTAVFPYECDVINIREFPFQAGASAASAAPPRESASTRTASTISSAAPSIGTMPSSTPSASRTTRWARFSSCTTTASSATATAP